MYQLQTLPLLSSQFLLLAERSRNFSKALLEWHNQLSGVRYPRSPSPAEGVGRAFVCSKIG